MRIIKKMQPFKLIQSNHSIFFLAYDIEKCEKITPESLSRIYVSECEKVSLGGINNCNPKKVTQCVNCDTPHFQDFYIDGWVVRNKNGMLDDDCYVATLQTGIRVPVPKYVYLAYLQGFSDEPYSACEDSIIELH